jgi:hypothetical protein
MYQTLVLLFTSGIDFIDFSDDLLIQWEDIARLNVRGLVLFQEKKRISSPQQTLKDGLLPRIQRDWYCGGVHGRKRKGSWNDRFWWDLMYMSWRSRVELWLER